MNLKMSRRAKSLAILLLFIITYTLAWIGLAKWLPESNTMRYMPDRIYRLVKIGLGGDPTSSGLEPKDIPWELIAVKVLVIFIILGGLYKILQKAFFTQYTAVKIAMRRNHTIIIGTNSKGLGILEDIKQEQGTTAVAIEQDAENKNIGSVRRAGHALIVGDATNGEVLDEAGIYKAKYLICFIEDEQTGLLAAQKVKEIWKAAEDRQLQCFIHLKNLQLMEALQQTALHEQRVAGGLHISFFNTPKITARLFFNSFVRDYSDAIAGGAKFRLLIFGWSDVARALVIQALRVLHLQHADSVELVCCTEDAERDERIFREQYPQVRHIAPVYFRQYDGTYRQVLDEFNTRQYTPVLISAFDDDEENLGFALRVIGGTPAASFNVYCLNYHSRGMNALLANGGAPGRLRFFGSLRAVCRMEMIVHERLDRMARAIHEDYLQTAGTPALSESERYKASWAALNEDARDANRAQADHIPYKYAMLGRLEELDNNEYGKISAEDTEMLAQAEHRRWAAHRYLNGWRYGDERNDAERLHPSLVEWDALPDREKQKDVDTVLKIPAVTKLNNVQAGG